MDIWEYKDFFDEKMTHEAPSDDEPLDYAHQFLKMVLGHLPNCSDPVVGHFEIPNRGIKYDGYFLDEDEKEFHLLSLAYFDDLDSLNEKKMQDVENDCYRGAIKFIETALSGKCNIGTENEVGEHVQELIEDLKDDYKIIWDFFSNVEYPDDFIPTTISTGMKEIDVEDYDAKHIYDVIEADETESLIIEFKRKYSEPLTAIRVSRNDDFDVYLTSIGGSLLSKVYADHKSRLMDGNVRAYLKRTQKTNKGITQSLRETPENFVAYNNGISAVAAADNSEIKPIGDDVYLINALDKMQIVNGGQTTVTIYECAKEGTNLEEVIVPVKLTVLKNQTDQAELVSNIAIYANTQTAISKSDLASNKPFYKNLEALSRKNPCYRTMTHSKEDAYYWFFERANGLYNTRKRIIWNYSKTFTRQFPEKNKFSKKALAKAVMAYAKKPDIVCMGNEKCFSEFNSIIDKNVITPDNQYYRNTISSLIFWREADKIIAKNKLPIKAAVLPYTIAYISEKTRSLIDFGIIWNNQTLPKDLKNAIDKVSRTISDYFRGSQDLHPNTLMWGRKKECWEDIKKLCCNLGDYDIPFGSQPVDFFPENPAATFIGNSKNFNDQTLWMNLLQWDTTKRLLSKTEKAKVEGFIASIELSGKVLLSKDQNAGKAIFLKCVQNGFIYR